MQRKKVYCDQCGKVLFPINKKFRVHQRDGKIRTLCYFCFAKQIPKQQETMEELNEMFTQLNDQVIELARIVQSVIVRIEMIEKKN